jgi:hypothetical protein
MRISTSRPDGPKRLLRNLCALSTKLARKMLKHYTISTRRAPKNCKGGRLSRPPAIRCSCHTRLTKRLRHDRSQLRP